MEMLYAIVLGAIQGITEFLPISSTGHLILVRELFSLDNSRDALAFDAVLQLATMGAVILYFARDLGMMVHTALRMVGGLAVDHRDRTLVFALVIGTIPAIVLGLLLEDLMATAFRSPFVVAGVLLFGSALFAYAEYAYTYRKGRTPLSVATGGKIGLFQALALIPGMSRSGATISGGLILGLTRQEATRFAFLLAVPILSGAGAKKLFEILGHGGGADLWPLAAGAVTAFLVGLGAIHFMMHFMRTNSLWPFIWYRVALAIFVIALALLG